MGNTMRNTRTLAVLVAVLVQGLVLVLPASARASVLYWDNPVSGCWDTDSDWAIDTSGDGATTWVPGDDADFYANGSPTSTITISNSVNVGNITFDGSGYTVTGGILNISSGSTTITANQNATINSQITGTGVLVVAGAGVLTINGTNNTYNGGTVVNSGTLSVGPGVSNGGPGVNYSGLGFGTVTVNAGGTLVGQAEALGYGYNSIAAPLAINGGVVTANASAGCPGGTTILFCGALAMTGGTINGDNFAPNGPVTINAAAAPAIISSNYFYLDNTGGRISSFNVARGGGSADLVINSTVQDWGYTGWITKTGAGIMVLNGAVGYGGSTTINGGTLVVNNSLSSSAVTIGASGTLSGSGNISTGVDSSGTITPGYGSAGTLTVSSATLESSSALNYSLGTASNSLLSVGGALTLSSSVSLSVTPGASWAAPAPTPWPPTARSSTTPAVSAAGRRRARPLWQVTGIPF